MLHKKIDKSSIEKTGSGNVKIDRNFIISLVNSELNVPSSTIDLLLSMSLYIDVDCKLTISLESLRKQIGMREDTFKFALERAISLDLIEVKNDTDYFSKIHINIDSNITKYTYIPNLKLFTTPGFKALNLNQKRLLLYFIAAVPVGYVTKVAINNLYNNSLHREGKGVKCFYNYREVIEALILFTNLGFIELKIHVNDVKKNIINEDNLIDYDCAQLIKDNLEIPKEKARTKWLYLAKRKNINISVSVIQTDVLSLNASMEEISDIARENDMPIEFVNCETHFKYLIGYKNELVENFGLRGLEIYREQLRNYFADSGHMLDYYMTKNKFANYFKDYYVDKAVQSELMNLIEKHNDSSLTLSQRVILDRSITKHIKYLESSLSSSSIILLKSKLESVLEGVSLNTSMDNFFTFAEEKLLEKYTSFLKKYQVACDYNDFKYQYVMNREVEQRFLENYLIDLLEKTKQVSYSKTKIQLLQQQAANLFNFYKTNDVTIQKKAPFYNWLEDRS